MRVKCVGEVSRDTPAATIFNKVSSESLKLWWMTGNVTVLRWLVFYRWIQVSGIDFREYFQILCSSFISERTLNWLLSRSWSWLQFVQCSLVNICVITRSHARPFMNVDGMCATCNIDIDIISIWKQKNFQLVHCKCDACVSVAPTHGPVWWCDCF